MANGQLLFCTLLNQLLFNLYFNDITSKSHEQRQIAKEHIVMYDSVFKPSSFVIKGL